MRHPRAASRLYYAAAMSDARERNEVELAEALKRTVTGDVVLPVGLEHALEIVVWVCGQTSGCAGRLQEVCKRTIEVSQSCSRLELQSVYRESGRQA